ncbi:endolytic transglycosylase MltG [Sporosarcina sp. Te-1]|uniref:endolytic transglycosylase MltG n=1 Tax=Sporosarcina sp. Te-1 TaxID=2818390 RepID=UPI001A9FC012|nr:endolytic transglycosylase MltG [Sporosarcina sp. Te-1]QTD41689.1 endolytic transglycosylase MltG [Sporosarcina sp. Te-1]
MMLRDIFRSVGIGCLLAGGILYFVGPASEGHPKTADDSRVKQLEEELEAVKKELAIAQRTSSVDTNKVNQTEKPQKEKATSSEGQIVKTILTIETGAVSTKISSRLERAGIIDSAKEFDQYLQTNGLSGRIQVGDYEVDSSMDLKTIAAIITKGK